MIINMECLAGMSACLADNSIDAVVTDPPYGLSKEPDMMEVMKHWMNGDDYVHTGGGFMGKSWDSFVPGPAIWKEVFRVLKPGGHLLAFFGSRTYDLGTLAIRLAGFEIRDQIMWVYGSGFPKSLDVSKAIDKSAPTTDEAKQWSGWGTALKPAHEPICVARKPLEGIVAANVLAHGTGGLNIDGCRVAAGEQIKGGSGGLLSHKRDNTEYPQKEWSPSERGRWPANFVHDGSDEVIKHFPYTKSGAIKAGSSAGVDMRAGNSDNTRKSGRPVQPRNISSDEGSAARFFYCAKASKADRNEGVSLTVTSAADMVERDADSAGMNSPRAGAGRTSGARNDHPTVKPAELMRWLVRLVTPPGGTVLDPFTGSGSTGKACAIEGFEFIGFEMDGHYCEIAEQRINAVKSR